MHDLLQGLSQQWDAVSTNYYVHQLIDAVQQLWEGIRDRLTLANAFKVVLLVVALYLTLRIVGSKNGIKGSQEWPRLKVQVDDRLSDQEVRLPRGNFVPRTDAKKYDDRSGTVIFREVAPPPPWYTRLWKRVCRLGRGPKPTLRHDCTFVVPLIGPLNEGLIFVSREIFEQKLSGDKYDNPNGNGTALADKFFDVTAKRTNSLRFLLNHPDPSLRTTAWVVLVGTLFEIFKSVIFE
jgi:hypothetical protein